MVRRDEAVTAASVPALAELLARDDDLIAGSSAAPARLDAAGDEATRDALERVEATIAARTRKIDDLTELAGEGTDEDRAAFKVEGARCPGGTGGATGRAKHGSAGRSTAARTPLTPDRVREQLADLTGLLDDGAAGALGADVVYRAADGLPPARRRPRPGARRGPRRPEADERARGVPPRPDRHRPQGLGLGGASRTEPERSWSGSVNLPRRTGSPSGSTSSSTTTAWASARRPRSSRRTATRATRVSSGSSTTATTR